MSHGALATCPMEPLYNVYPLWVMALLCYLPLIFLAPSPKYNPLERVAGAEVQGPLEEVLAQ